MSKRITRKATAKAAALAALNDSYARRMAAEYGMQLADWLDIQARLTALNDEANAR